MSPTLEDALVHPNFSGSSIWRNGELSFTAEDRNPTPDALVGKRDRILYTHTNAPPEAGDDTWVLYIPIYIPDFLLAWLRRIEIVTTDHVQESFTDGNFRVTYFRQKSMTHGVSDDSDHGCSQKECWDDLQHPHGGERESERGRAERLERRLAAVEHRKEVLAARLRREEARSGQLEEERARLARLVARRAAAPAPPDARSLLPPSFSRSPAQLSAHAAASSPVAYDMAYSSLLGL